MGINTLSFLVESTSDSEYLTVVVVVVVSEFNLEFIWYQASGLVTGKLVGSMMMNSEQDWVIYTPTSSPDVVSCALTSEIADTYYVESSIFFVIFFFSDSENRNYIRVIIDQNRPFSNGWIVTNQLEKAVPISPSHILHSSERIYWKEEDSTSESDWAPLHKLGNAWHNKYKQVSRYKFIFIQTPQLYTLKDFRKTYGILQLEVWRACRRWDIRLFASESWVDSASLTRLHSSPHTFMLLLETSARYSTFKDMISTIMLASTSTSIIYCFLSW